MRIEVNKRDGSKEEYCHTKVVGSIVNALSETGQADIAAAEEIAEAITFYLHNNDDGLRNISSSEILSIIEAVLADTGYVQAAIALNEHYYERKLMRSRLEVAKSVSSGNAQTAVRSRWEKNRIVEDLTVKKGLERQMARAIASMVEEKVFNLGLTLIPSGLVEQLVINDTEVVIQAQRQFLAT